MAPRHRGRGLGRRLLDALIAQLPADARRLYIEHFVANHRAGTFYEREGFTVDSFGALIAETSLELRPDLVTAHGFCMYIPACVLARAGYFDEEHFGRGYGEENDFCERALALGFRIRLADDTFVYHAGGASFDAAATSAQSTANYRTLVRLHPGYFPKVARFIEQNPLGPVHANLRLALRRRASSAPALLALLHASFDQPGGGTEHHVRDLLQSFGLPFLPASQRDRDVDDVPVRLTQQPQRQSAGDDFVVRMGRENQSLWGVRWNLRPGPGWKTPQRIGLALV